MKRRNVECVVLILALLMSLVSVSAFAAPVEEKAALLMEDVIVNDFDSTYYNDGGTVVNNFGIVYNNGGTVYNNGGTVYNNEGTVYNNGGVVFNNGAEVYNNGGTVYNNDGGIVHETGLVAPVSEAAEAPAVAASVEVNAAANAPVQAPAAEVTEEPAQLPVIENPEAAAEAAPVPGADSAAPAEESADEAELSGVHLIELAEDYSALALIEGLTELPDGSFVIREGTEAVIRAKDGLIITHTMTTAGTCSSDNMGTITLANVDRDGKLTLKFKAKSPHASLASGSYDDEKYLSLSAEAAGARVLYTTDNNSAPQSGKEALGALKIDKSMVIRAVTVMEGAADSEVIELTYVFPEVEEPEFKSVKAGYKAVAPKPAVLVNTGLDTVYVESVRLDGKNADCFTLSTGKGGRLASGQKDDSTWMIAPVEGLEPGGYEAEVVFTFASGDSISEDFQFTVKK